MIHKPHLKTGTRPQVILNMAMTADGKTASANRQIHAFGSSRDQRHLYKLRSTADAILCGSRTVEISRALLDNGGNCFTRARISRGLAAHPLRIIVSGSGSINPGAPIFQHSFSPILLITTRRISGAKKRVLSPLFEGMFISPGSNLDFHAAFRWLRDKWKVRRMVCEGGAELNAALFASDLVDELHLTICPLIMGGNQASTIADGKNGFTLAQAKLFKMTSCMAVGEELFTTYTRLPSD